MKKNRILFLSLFLVLFALVFSLFNFNVKANSSSVSIEGVQVRNTGVIGIRFVGKVDDDYQGAPSAYGVLLAYGKANIDQVVLNGTFGGKSILDGRVTELDETNNYYVNLINIPADMYGQEVTARAYFIENGEVVYSSESKTTSLGAATLTLVSLGEMTEGDNIEFVFKTLKENYKKYHTDANGNVFITSPVYETNLENLEKEFVNDWNAKFDKNWTEISYSSLQASASYIDENTKLEDVSLDCSQTNLYKFFNDEETSTKWGWLLDYLYSIGTVHPKRQINAIQNGGTATNDSYSNGVMSLQSFKHLSASIVNFFNGGCCRDTVDILFNDVNKYLTVDQYNNKIMSSTPKLVYIGNSIQLEILTSENGYSFDGYVLGEEVYNDEYDVTAETQILVPSYSLENYTITYFNGDEELTSLSSTYTINDTVTLTHPGIDGFVSWHENSDFSDDPVTTIEAGTFGHKIYYANVVNEKTVTVTFDYMDAMTKEEIWSEFRSDVYELCTNDTGSNYASRAENFLTTSEHSWDYDYLPLGVALSESSEFRAKWAWLFNAIADAHENVEVNNANVVAAIKALPTDDTKNAYSEYASETIYVFCQELKGFYNEIQATKYGTYTMYDWSADTLNEYNAVYSSSKTTGYTENLIVGCLLTNPEFTKDGYYFAGWYTTSNYLESTKVTTVPNESCTLYAKWESLSTITFNTNGGYFGYPSLEAMEKDFINDVNSELGSSLTSIIDYHNSTRGNIWKSEYSSFRAKWLWLINYIYASNTSLWSSGDAKVAMDTVLSGGTDGRSVYATQNIVLVFRSTNNATAKLSVEEGGLGISFDSSYTCIDFSSQTNGFWSEYIQKSTITIESAKVLPTNVYKEGYTFAGWYTTSTFDEGTLVTSANKSTTVYAKWEEINAEEMIDETINELDDYFNNLGVVTSDLELSNTNESYGTSLSYSSLNTSIIANDGKFNRPYQATTVTLNVTVSFGGETKTKEYEINVAGFKALNNIASTYIGGNSSTYLSLSNSLFEICDIITCGFAHPAADGTFTADSVNSLNYTYYLPRMSQNVISQAHEQGTYVVLSIAGMSEYDPALETICASDALIDTFISNIIGIINEYGFDGVDIDWEIPSNGTLFTKLMKKLYTAVKANNVNHLVTAAIGGGTDQPVYYDLSNSHQYIDYINMMTYNMASSYGYHHTALYASSNYHNSTNKVAKTLSSCSVDESVEIYKNYGVPASKLIIGSGFYGMVQTRTTTSGTWTDAETIVSYTNIKNNYLTDTTNYTSYYDDVCQVPYLISNDRLTFISYENATSVLAKCNYVKDNSLGGIFSWHYGLDDGDLLNSFKVGLSK